jgi:hypothetical protein
MARTRGLPGTIIPPAAVEQSTTRRTRVGWRYASVCARAPPQENAEHVDPVHAEMVEEADDRPGDVAHQDRRDGHRGSACPGGVEGDTRASAQRLPQRPPRLEGGADTVAQQEGRVVGGVKAADDGDPQPQPADLHPLDLAAAGLALVFGHRDASRHTQPICSFLVVSARDAYMRAAPAMMAWRMRG